MDKELASGIYSITHVASGRKYVGQARHFGRRWGCHRSQLRRGVHHSSVLQRAWDKYGADAFVFAVLERVAPDLLCDREQHWIDTLSPAFNLKPTSTPGWSGMHHSDEAKAKISRFRKTDPEARRQLAALHAAKRGVPRSPETVEKMRTSRLGFRHSPETIAKLKNIAATSNFRHTEEAKARISEGLRKVPFVMTEARRAVYESRRGQPAPDATRAALIKAITGRACSAETRAKIGAKNSANMKGKKQSPDLVEKRVAPLRGRKRPPEVMAKCHEALRKSREAKRVAKQSA